MCMPATCYHAKVLIILTHLPLLKHVQFIFISQAFHKVWNEGLLLKFRSFDMQYSLLNLIKIILSNRLQRVVLNCYCSTWEDFLAGVPQGSIL